MEGRLKLGVRQVIEGARPEQDPDDRAQRRKPTDPPLDGNGGVPGNVDVVVRRSPALADADAMRIITAEGQTARVVGELDQNVAVPGIGDPVKARIFRGDSSHLGFLLVTGRWFNNAGEVVAPRALMQDAHLKIGDRFTVTVGSKPVGLVLVGELYDLSSGGNSLSLDWSTVSPVEPDVAPPTYLITVMPGSNVDAYVRRVAAAQPPDLFDVQKNATSAVGPEEVVTNVLLIVAAVIIVIGVADIFNTLLLNTRERIRDTATLKAIGMSPRQVMVMVAASAALLALVGGAIAVPAGVGLDCVLFILIDYVAGNDTPPAIHEVFAAWELVAIPLAGVAVAVAAALIPGR